MHWFVVISRGHINGLFCEIKNTGAGMAPVKQYLILIHGIDHAVIFFINNLAPEF